MNYPILTLRQHNDRISTVCFVPSNYNNNNNNGQTNQTKKQEIQVKHEFDNHDINDNSEDDDSEDDDRLLLASKFNCNNKNNNNNNTKSLLLDKTLLASSDVNGNAYLWDLSTHRILSKIQQQQTSLSSSGGLYLHPISNNKLLYHTRDGIVSLYDINQTLCPVTSISTGSKTFCTASPCIGNDNLIVVPCEDPSHVMVRDWRISPTASPVLHSHACNSVDNKTGVVQSGYGMLMNVSMISSSSSSSMTLCCGMESGDLFFHDCTNTSNIYQCNNYNTTNTQNNIRIRRTISTSISKDPILCTDLSNINNNDKSTTSSHSLLAIAGCAGDDKTHPTLSILKTKFPHVEEKRLPRIKMRQQIKTMTNNNNNILLKSKPGISCCKFNKQGNKFAIGSWDNRCRIYDSTNGNILQILKFHKESITALDWLCLDNYNGDEFLVTASADGRTSVWSV